ncbi:hypothetical protein [Aquabacter sediminis]|uniref:hypothetical protein n=1 Tax=Aquabacter sediminis TaxID=3029197 RepID=UPI00237EA9CF|nr:hypothetical protein [Aquabacter sp. P-9]MDE1569309.1 hypothetical protein [Aquabacter sp. P-9]
MTLTIHVPIFPMREEIEARRQRRSFSQDTGGSRRRSRDGEGFLELELLPLDELDNVESATAKARRWARKL